MLAYVNEFEPVQDAQSNLKPLDIWHNSCRTGSYSLFKTCFLPDVSYIGVARQSY